MTRGPYAVVRHPQYLGLMILVFGFLVQWPTIITLAMAPFLFAAYVRLAKREEADLHCRFGPTYDEYAGRVAGFLPRRRLPGGGVEDERGGHYADGKSARLAGTAHETTGPEGPPGEAGDDDECTMCLLRDEVGRATRSGQVRWRSSSFLQPAVPDSLPGCRPEGEDEGPDSIGAIRHLGAIGGEARLPRPDPRPSTGTMVRGRGRVHHHRGHGGTRRPDSTHPRGRAR